MRVTVILSDADYQRIISANGKRVRGSMRMIDPSEFDFHAFAPAPDPPAGVPRQVLRTKHGKTTILSDRVKVLIVAKRGKDSPYPTETIYDEADTSAEFIMANVR